MIAITEKRKEKRKGGIVTDRSSDKFSLPLKFSLIDHEFLIRFATHSLMCLFGQGELTTLYILTLLPIIQPLIFKSDYHLYNKNIKVH